MCFTKKIIFLFCIGSITVLQSLLAQNPTPALSVRLKPFEKDALFHSRDLKVGYNIKLKNEVKDIQRGNYYFDVRNDSGRSIFNDNAGFVINEHSNFEKDITLNKTDLKPGCYEVSINIQTNHYKDTLKHFFCYDPEIVAFADSTKPADFFQFWEEAKRELVNTNPYFKVTKVDSMGDKFADVYAVEFFSIEKKIIRGWLSVPKEKSKFPVIYNLYNLNQPCYPDKQREVATFTIDVRGTGMSADALKLNPDEYLITNADYKRRFILRSVYMDCLRGLDFIYRSDSLKLDTKHVAVVGVGQSALMAIAVVALDGRPNGLSIERPVPVDINNLINISEQSGNYQWPVTVFKNYVENPLNKINQAAFKETWSYFDPLAFASLIHCKFLMGVSLRSASPPKCIYHFINKLTIGRRDIYVCPECNNAMNSAFIELQKVWLHEVF